MRFSYFAIALAVTAGGPALAQRAPERAVTFGAFGGSAFSVPKGDVPSIYNTGMQAGALVEVRTPVPWLALRVDGSYQRLGLPTQGIADETGRVLGQLNSYANVLTASATVVARVPGLRAAVQPYAVAGVTAFRLQSQVSQSGGPSLGPLGAGPVLRTRGANVGLGLDAPVGRALLFVEARYARMGPEVRNVPLSIGVKLR